MSFIPYRYTGYSIDHVDQLNSMTSAFEPNRLSDPSSAVTPPPSSAFNALMPIDPALTAAPATPIHPAVPPAAPAVAPVRPAAPTIAPVRPAVPPVTPVTPTVAAVSHAGPAAVHGPRLTEEEDTILLQICLQKRSAYSVPKKRTEFWQKVNVEFVCEAKRPYNSSKRHVESLVEKRKQYLAGLATGGEDSETNLTRVLDA